MNDNYKKILPFLENNIYLINSNQFEKLYATLPTVKFGGVLTELLLKADINPLQYMHIIPSYFLLKSKISSINIPNTITTIMSEAFFNADIRRLVIPSSVKNIQKSAFYKSYIEKIIFSAYNDLDIIPEKCFSRSINLSNVDIPDHTTEIGPEAFAYCSSLKYIDLKKYMF